MAIIYIAVLLCSIAFAIATFYISFVLSRLADTITSLGTSVGRFEKQMEYITPQLVQTVRETDKMIDETMENLKATDSLFDTAHDFGSAAQSLNEVYEKNRPSSDVEMESKMRPFVEGLTWSEAAAQLFKKWRAAKPSGKNEVMVTNTDIVPVNQGKEG